MKRFSIFAYGIFCYAAFFVTFTYALGFIGNFAVPKSIDSVPTVGTGTAMFIDLLLLFMFALQHSVMARPGFKRVWTRVVPQAAERSTYVLFSSVALAVLMALWQPLGGLIWDVQGTVARGVFHGVFIAGTLLVFASSFLIDHFDLFGLRQTWLHARGKPYTSPTFKQPWLYRQIRHPLYLGWFMVIWATPTMTITHLFFALALTLYTFLGITLEERDLSNAHPEYREYQKRVPMIFPSLRARFARRSAPVTTDGAS